MGSLGLWGQTLGRTDPPPGQVLDLLGPLPPRACFQPRAVVLWQSGHEVPGVWLLKSDGCAPKLCLEYQAFHSQSSAQSLEAQSVLRVRNRRLRHQQGFAPLWAARGSLGRLVGAPGPCGWRKSRRPETRHR